MSPSLSVLGSLDFAPKYLSSKLSNADNVLSLALSAAVWAALADEAELAALDALVLA